MDLFTKCSSKLIDINTGILLILIDWFISPLHTLTYLCGVVEDLSGGVEGDGSDGVDVGVAPAVFYVPFDAQHVTRKRLWNLVSLFLFTNSIQIFCITAHFQTLMYFMYKNSETNKILVLSPDYILMISSPTTEKKQFSTLPTLPST